MARIELGSGRQRHLFERDGDSDTITDFRSLYFDSTLDEGQEVPPNNDRAGIDGTGEGVLNFARTRFDFSLDINGIDLAGGAGPDDMIDMHIHGAEVGEAGDVIFDFRNDDDDTEIDAGDGTVVGTWNTDEAVAQDMTPADVTALLAEETYFNIHTNRDEAGWIRGQILKDGGSGDKVDLGDLNIGSFETLLAITSNRAGDAVISAVFDGEESRLRLDGVEKGALKAGHFVFAGDEDQTIDGSAERDDLFGAGGDDEMNGLGGDDLLYGEDEADTLSGGAGGDRMVGGLGLDEMSGGRGADRFIFRDVAESGDGAGTADQIIGFAADRDLIVLSAIDARGAAGDQDFTFIEGDAFDAAGQVRVTERGGDTLLSLNTRGAGDAEMVIRLDGQVVVTETDLIL